MELPVYVPTPMSDGGQEKVDIAPPAERRLALPMPFWPVSASNGLAGAHHW